jgi:hypothetical protein
VLQPLAGAPLTSQQWHQATSSLLAAQVLAWQDTDKKGRPRSRDCRPFLLELRLAELFADGAVALHLRAAIDASGRSLRPEQLQHWFAGLLGQPLALTSPSRQALLLKPVLSCN